MRKVFILLLLIGFSSLDTFSQARFSLNLKGLERPVNVIVPVNGKFIMHHKQQLDPMERKSYFLKLDETKPGFIYIFYNFKLIPIFLKPGMQTKVKFLDKKLPHFSGDHQLENTWFNQWEKRFVSPYSSSIPSLTDTIFTMASEQAFSAWKSMLHEHLQDLEANCADCDAAFKTMVQKDLLYYYANEFVRSIFRHSSSKIIFEQIENFAKEDHQAYQAFTSSWAPVWDSIYHYVSIDQNALFSQDYLAFLRAYFDVYRLGYKKEYANQYDDRDSREELLLQLAREKLSKPVYEAFYAFNLEYMLGGGPSIYTPDFIARYETFQEQFPESDFLLSLEQSMQPAYEFINRPENMPDLNHILSTDQLPTLQSLLKEFQGKVVLVDLWATWCGPCLEELEYADELYAFTQDKLIVPLYVSVDKPEDKDKWKKFIAKYHLQGSHIQASKELVQDIWMQVGDEGQQGYPRYIIADQEGNVVVKDAYRPSDGQKLYDQLANTLEE